MEELNQDLKNRSDENQARENAVAAFLGLGEKLLSFYQRGKASEASAISQNALGASALFSTIEGEIIPRLMLAHDVKPLDKPIDAVRREEDPTVLSAGDHEHFLQVLRQDSAIAAGLYVETLLKRGVSQDVVFLDLLGTAARRLGELWEQDICDFSDVTIGLCRLHEILRKNSKLYHSPYSPGGAPGKRVLLATACGDQHVFGVVMVAEFFRQAGWRVSSEPGASCDQLAKILKTQHFDVLCLSAACSAFADDIGDEISRLRASTTNKDLKILVGGRLFSEQPDLVASVGADAMAEDAKGAPEIGRKLLAAAGLHC